MTELPDGEYSVFIVEADESAPGKVRLELTITAGSRKGDIVTVVADNLARDPLDYLGLPAELVVADGAPRVVFDE